VFPDMENWSFERSIYKRLKGLNLRDSDASASKMYMLEKHWSQDSGKEIALDLHRALAKDALSPLCFQTQLSAIVLPLSRSCLLEKLHQAINAPKAYQTGFTVARAENAMAMEASAFLESTSEFTAVNDGSSSMNLGRAFVQAAFTFSGVFDGSAAMITGKGLPHSIPQLCVYDRSEDEEQILFKGKDAAYAGLNRAQRFAEQVLILIQDIDRNLRVGGSKPLTESDRLVDSGAAAQGNGLQFQEKYAVRFGTTPLWYLQSMATGPPSQHSSPQ